MTKKPDPRDSKKENKGGHAGRAPGKGDTSGAGTTSGGKGKDRPAKGYGSTDRSSHKRPPKGDDSPGSGPPSTPPKPR